MLLLIVFIFLVIFQRGQGFFQRQVYVYSLLLLSFFASLLKLIINIMVRINQSMLVFVQLFILQNPMLIPSATSVVPANTIREPFIILFLFTIRPVILTLVMMLDHFGQLIFGQLLYLDLFISKMPKRDSNFKNYQRLL